MKMKPLFLSLALLLSAVVSANAQVLVEATAFADNTATNTGNSLSVLGFNLGAGNALAVIVNSEAGGGSGTPVYSVTFAGNPVTNNVFVNQGAQGAGIFWVINPSTTTGNIVVSLGADTNSRGAISVLSISNVLAVGDTKTGVATNGAASATPTFSLTYAGTTGGLALAGFVDNAASVGAPPTIANGNIDTTLQGFNAGASAASAGIIQRYGDIPSDGSFTADFKASANGTSSTRNAGALVAFTAVPEPTTFVMLLSGTGLLTMVRRRRSA